MISPLKAVLNYKLSVNNVESESEPRRTKMTLNKRLKRYYFLRANRGETETERETLTARQTDRLISSGGEIERERDRETNE